MNMLWFFIACFFIFLEVGHPGLFYFLSFSIGSMAAFAASWLEYSIFIQGALFLFISIVSIFLLLFFLKRIDLDLPSERSNIFRLVGKEVVVISVQSEKKGIGRVGQEEWTVILDDGDLVKGMRAVVKAVQGCHLSIKPVKK